MASTGTVAPVTRSSNHQLAALRVLGANLGGCFGAAVAVLVISGSRGRSGMLHSNPGDYAWGQSGLDAIVTQVRPRPGNGHPGRLSRVSLCAGGVCAAFWSVG